MKNHAFHRIIVGIAGLFLCFSLFNFWHFTSSNVSAKEDDEEREYEREDDYEREDERDDEDAVDEAVVTEKVTVSDTVSKEVTTTTYVDTDGDGILNRDDRYPTINDHFIVNDDNRNGIVDSYEQ